VIGSIFIKSNFEVDKDDDKDAYHDSFAAIDSLLFNHEICYDHKHFLIICPHDFVSTVICRLCLRLTHTLHGETSMETD
jgi:hypothetical protein